MKQLFLTLLVLVSVRAFAHADAPTPIDVMSSVQMEIPNNAWGFLGAAFALMVWLYKSSHKQTQDLIQTNLEMSRSYVEQSTNNTKVLLENSYKAIDKMTESLETLSDAVNGMKDAMQEMQRGFSEDRKQMIDAVSSLREGIKHLHDRHDAFSEQLKNLDAKVDKLKA